MERFQLVGEADQVLILRRCNSSTWPKAAKTNFAVRLNIDPPHSRWSRVKSHGE
jgi:hypothetical protein